MVGFLLEQSPKVQCRNDSHPRWLCYFYRRFEMPRFEGNAALKFSNLFHCYCTPLLVECNRILLSRKSHLANSILKATAYLQGIRCGR